MRPGVAAGLLFLTLMLMAGNLRAAVSSVGPVLREMQVDLMMSDTVAGLLTTLPVVCFGAFGLLAGRLSRRIGTETGLVVATALIAVGLAARAFSPNVVTLLLLSLLPLAGIAIGNVLTPVLVKAWFPSQVGRMTGWYSLAIAVGTAVPAALTVPLADTFGGWQAGIGLWAVPAALALLPWIEIARRRRAGGSATAPPSASAPAASAPGSAASAPTVSGDENPAAPTEAPAATPPASKGAAVKVHRQWKAWALALFFGLQVIEAYTAMGWLAAILRDAGTDPGRAGFYVAVTTGIGAPVSLILPRLAARSDDQRPWVITLVVASIIAYTGLIVAPGSAPLLWAVLLGIGLGTFPLALVLIGLRSTTSAGTASLSALVQGVGYLLAAGGPLAIGFLHDLTGAWTVPLLALVGILVPKLITGLIAAAPGAVDVPKPQ